VGVQERCRARGACWATISLPESGKCISEAPGGPLRRLSVDVKGGQSSEPYLPDRPRAADRGRAYPLRRATDRCRHGQRTAIQWLIALMVLSARDRRDRGGFGAEVSRDSPRVTPAMCVGHTKSDAHLGHCDLQGRAGAAANVILMAVCLLVSAAGPPGHPPRRVR
jgi:hypothetical protein